jgi:hypothetical protein
MKDVIDGTVFIRYNFPKWERLEYYGREPIFQAPLFAMTRKEVTTL